MPPVAAAASAAAAWYASSGLIVQLATRVAIGFIIAAAAQQLLGKPKASTPLVSTTGRQDSIRQALSPRRTVYGETLAGGTVVYIETGGTSQNEFLSILTARAAHQIGGFEELWRGDERLVVNSDNTVQAANHSRYDGRFWAFTHVGTDDQVADERMLAYTAGGWTTNHRLRGVAYDHCQFKYSQDAQVWNDFNYERFRWRIRGKLLYDPRDAGTRYAQNPALAIRDYLVNRLGVAAAEINDTTVSAAANVCDEQVSVTNTTQTFTASASTDVLTLTTNLDNLRRGNVVRVSNSGGALPTGLSAGTDYYVIPVSELGLKLATSYANALAGTAIDITGAGSGTQTLTLRSEARYTVAGIVQDSDQPADVLRALCQAMAGVLTYSGGKFEVYAGASGTSVLTLTEDHLRGPIKVVPRRSRQQLFNRVKATYVDPDRGYQPTTAPAVTNATYLANDNAEQIWQTLDLPFCDSGTRAQRLAKIDLERCRQQITVHYPCKLIGLQLKVWDIVAVTNSRFGWTAKEFRVIGWAIGPDGGVDLTLAEEATTMWTWSAEETAVDAAPDTNLPSFRTVTAPPLPITVTEDLRETATGTVVNVLKCSINASADQFTAKYKWQYKKTSDTDYVALPNTGQNVEIPGVADETSYTVRVAAENWLGYLSDFISKVHVTVGQTAPPATVSNFSINIVEDVAHLTWDPVADVDLSHYVIRWSPVTSGAEWASAIDIVPRVARPATSVRVPAKVGTYLIKAEDLRGNRSVSATSIVTTITAIAGLNAVATVTESPTFAGTHSSTATVDSTLRLDTSINFDSGVGNFDDGVGLFDGGGGNIATSGTYTFAGAVDLGAIYTSRVSASLTVSAVNYSGTQFDDGIGNFDDGVGLFDGENPDNVNAYLEIRTTTDDPTGAPTWGAWRPFTVGDYRAWGLQFRCQLTSALGSMTPVVSALSVTVDMPDRITEAHDQVSDAAGTAVTYSPAFKAAPGLGISAQNLATGDYYTIASKSRTGFTIRFFNAAGAGVSRTFDYVARGYGAQA